MRNSCLHCPRNNRRLRLLRLLGWHMVPGCSLICHGMWSSSIQSIKHARFISQYSLSWIYISSSSLSWMSWFNQENAQKDTWRENLNPWDSLASLGNLEFWVGATVNYCQKRLFRYSEQSWYCLRQWIFTNKFC